MSDTLRRDNAKHVAAINAAWGERVAWLVEEPSFEIESSLEGGMRPGRSWAPPFVTLRQVRREQ